MAILGKPYIRKPDSWVRPQRGHPRLRGCFALFPLNEGNGRPYNNCEEGYKGGTNAARELNWNPGGEPTDRRFSGNLYNDGSGNTYSFYESDETAHPLHFLAGDQFTLIYRFKLDDTAADYYTFGAMGGQWQWGLGVSSSNRPHLRQPAYVSLGGAFLYTDGAWETHAWSVDFNGSNATRLWVLQEDGDLLFNGTGLGTGGSPADRKAELTVMGAKSANDAPMELEWFRIYTELVPDNIVRSIMKDPWAEWRKPLPIWLPVSVAAGEISELPLGALTVNDLVPTANTTENKFTDVPIGALTVNSQTPAIIVSELANIPLGSLTLTALTPSVLIDEVSSIPLGSLTLNTLAMTVETTENKQSDLPLGSLVLNDLAMTVDVTESDISEIPLGTLVVTDLAMTVLTSEDQISELPLGALTLTGLAMTVDVPAENTSEIPLGTLVLNDQTMTVLTSDNKFVDVPLGSLILNGFAPTVINTDIAAIPLGSLTLNTLAMTVETLQNNYSDIPLGSLTLNSLTPTVVTTEEKFVNFGLGSLTLNSFAPIVVTSEPAAGGRASTTASNLRSGPGILDIPVQ
ncbi:MAG: hypothetical protein ACYSUD_17190 [Planctomycetota bacterium]|jgi:hypothetical protein